MTASGGMPVYVVLLHYDKVHDTRRCLLSLREQKGVGVHAVVIDNGSLDEGWRALEREFPEVTLIKTGENLGFAGGNNIGIRHSLDQGARWILLLNNDTELRDPYLLRALIRTGEAIPNAGIVCPAVRDENNEQMQDTYLMRPAQTLREHLSNRRRKREAIPLGDDLLTVWGVAAVAWLIPRGVFERVGGLDEAIFIYGEDNDFCMRVHEAGRKVLVRRDLIVHHFFSSLANPSLGAPRNQGYLPNRIYLARKYGATLPHRLILMVASMFSSVPLLWRSWRERGVRWGEFKLWIRLNRALVRETLLERRPPREPQFR